MSTDRHWIALAAVAVLLVGTAVVIGTATGASGTTQDESSTAELVDQAETRTEEVLRIQAAASQVVVQLVGGAGLGVGFGIGIGAVAMYVFQRNRLREEFS